MSNFACATGLTGFQTTVLEGFIRSLEHWYGLRPDGFLAFLWHQTPQSPSRPLDCSDAGLHGFSIYCGFRFHVAALQIGAGMPDGNKGCFACLS